MFERQQMIKDVADKYGIGSKQDIFFRDLCKTFAYKDWNSLCIAASYIALMTEKGEIIFQKPLDK